jgi:ABC-type antimicrobial peptide transport system permease subunit
MDVGDHFLKTNGMTLLEGRDFVLDSKTDQKESIIVTEEFVRQFAWDQAVGKQILWHDSTKLFIVGVVKDIYSVWEPLEPMMFRYAPNEKVSFVLVKAKEGKVQNVNSFMEKKWKATFPNRVYESHYMNAGIMEADWVNKNLLLMFLFLGMVALLLSTTGLFTLVSLNILKRMKEIGVRKLLGASIVNIARMINTEFFIIVIIASAAGTYVGSFFSNMLMSNIWDHYQKPTMFTLLLACIVLIGGCVLSVAIKTYSTVKMNPVDVLKDE